MLLRLHPQGRDAGALAVRLAVQLVAIEAGADAGCAKEATHVSLAHVAAGTGDTEEVGDTASRVGMRVGGHAGGHRLTGDDASGHRGGGSVVANPGGVLDLWGKRCIRAWGRTTPWTLWDVWKTQCTVDLKPNRAWWLLW